MTPRGTPSAKSTFYGQNDVRSVPIGTLAADGSVFLSSTALPASGGVAFNDLPGVRTFSIAQLNALASYDVNISALTARQQEVNIVTRLGAFMNVNADRARVVPQSTGGFWWGTWEGVRDAGIAGGDAITMFQLPGAVERETQFRRNYGDTTWNITTFSSIVGATAVLGAGGYVFTVNNKQYYLRP